MCRVSARTRLALCTSHHVTVLAIGVRGGKTIPLKEVVDRAVKNCPDVQTVLVQSRTGECKHIHASQSAGRREEDVAACGLCCSSLPCSVCLLAAFLAYPVNHELTCRDAITLAHSINVAMQERTLRWAHLMLT